MEVLSLAIYLCELALVGLVLFHVIGWIPMSDLMRRIAQTLLVLVFVFQAISAMASGSRRVPAMAPYPPGPASIIR